MQPSVEGYALPEPTLTREESLLKQKIMTVEQEITYATVGTKKAGIITLVSVLQDIDKLVPTSGTKDLKSYVSAVASDCNIDLAGNNENLSSLIEVAAVILNQSEEAIRRNDILHAEEYLTEFYNKTNTLYFKAILSVLQMDPCQKTVDDLLEKAAGIKIDIIAQKIQQSTTGTMDEQSVADAITSCLTDLHVLSKAPKTTADQQQMIKTLAKKCNDQLIKDDKGNDIQNLIDSLATLLQKSQDYLTTGQPIFARPRLDAFDSTRKSPDFCALLDLLQDRTAQEKVKELEAKYEKISRLLKTGVSQSATTSTVTSTIATTTTPAATGHTTADVKPASIPASAAPAAGTTVASTTLTRKESILDAQISALDQEIKSSNDLETITACLTNLHILSKAAEITAAQQQMIKAIATECNNKLLKGNCDSKNLKYLNVESLTNWLQAHVDAGNAWLHAGARADAKQSLSDFDSIRATPYFCALLDLLQNETIQKRVRELDAAHNEISVRLALTLNAAIKELNDAANKKSETTQSNVAQFIENVEKKAKSLSSPKNNIEYYALVDLVESTTQLLEGKETMNTSTYLSKATQWHKNHPSALNKWIAGLMVVIAAGLIAAAIIAIPILAVPISVAATATASSLAALATAAVLATAGFFGFRKDVLTRNMSSIAENLKNDKTPAGGTAGASALVS